MPIAKRAVAELLGTFWLVFGGCGSAVLAAKFPEVGIGLVGVSLAFGLTVVTMAYAVGHISGGHFNPAITLGMLAGGRIQAAYVIPYIVAQLIGAVLAVGLLATCIVTVRAKLAGMVDAGQRADRQLDTILSYVPPDARDVHIATVFLKSDIDPRGTYAVYHVGDEVLAHSTPALTWRRPGQGLTLETLRVDDVRDVDLRAFDIVLLWDRTMRQLKPLKTLQSR
jgi:hypothetical protein